MKYTKYTKYQRRTRKNKGGVRTTNNYTDETAISYFFNNSTFRILGDDSVSCIPILVTLNPDKISNSPYKIVRTNYVNKSVSQLLIKIFIWGEKPGIIEDDKIRNGYINITTSESITTELNIQQEIYYKSFYDNSTIMEPLCPCIVFANPSKLPNEIKSKVLNIIKNNLIERSTDQTEQPRDNEIIERLLHYEIAFIAMEFMNDYQPLSNFKNDPKYETYKIMALYALDKLHKYGYSHNDFHFQNVMVNPGYRYFTNDIVNDTKLLGRIIIIDFGLADTIPKDVDMNNNNRIKLLNEEYGILHIQNIIKIFNHFDYKHTIVQADFVTTLEIKLRRNMREIINNFKIYRSKGGKIFIQKMNDKNIDNEDVKQSKIIDEWLTCRPKHTKREQEPIVIDDGWLNTILENDVKLFEEKLKSNDSQYYAEFIKGIDEINAEEPEYLDKLIKNVLSEPYITEKFEFPPNSRSKTMKNDK